VIAEPITLVKSPDVLLAEADIVSLHARLMPNAARLIDGPALAGMKPGSLLVNTARAALIDERALAAALDSGHVAGAALDVLTTPPAGERHPLIDHPRVIVTPHIGGATHETLARGARMMADAVADVAGGRVPAYLANPEVMQRGHAER
jgi:D-3-phosphoglycerate dehydrogenase